MVRARAAALAVPAASAVAAADPEACPACRRVHPLDERAALRALAQTPARLAALLDGLDARALGTPWSAGKWSIRQITSHLRDCEVMFAERWRRILAEDRPTLHPFDQDRFAERTGYARHDARLASVTFATLRASNLELLRLAGAAGLARVGIHAEYGPITLGQLVRHVAAHDHNHLTQIEAGRGLVRTKRRAKRPAKAARRR